MKSDQKYPPVIEMMCTALRNTNDANVQRELVDIFRTLCDYKLSLVQESAEAFEKQLAHSIPSKEPLLVIIAALIEILASASKYPVDIVETTLHILVSLTSHNYGLYHVKSCLENNPDALRNLLDYVAEGIYSMSDELYYNGRSAVMTLFFVSCFRKRRAGKERNPARTCCKLH